MPSPLKLAVIADDLTGALDAVAPFADAGLRTVVATSPADLQAALDQGPEVIGVSTNSRALPGPEAAKIVQTVAQVLCDVPLWFKKIDSRLKGNIAAEVAALLGVRRFDRALICPAIPQMGRRVVDGCLQGFGVETPLCVGQVLFDVGLTVDVPDVASDADFERILGALSPRTLLVGARGLSAAVAQRLRQGAPTPVALPLPRPIDFVIGSRDPITLAQVAHLRASQPMARYVAAPNGHTLGQGEASELLILHATSGPMVADPETVTRALAKTYLEHASANRACLVLTGGETAAAVLETLGLGVLEVIGEAVPGLPLCRAAGPENSPYENSPYIVTKSGGFGETKTLSLLVGIPQ